MCPRGPPGFNSSTSLNTLYQTYSYLYVSLLNYKFVDGRDSIQRVSQGAWHMVGVQVHIEQINEQER